MVHHPVVKVFSSKVSVSGSGLHFEDTLLNGEKRDIKGTTTKIKDQDVLLPHAGSLLVKTIGNCGSSGFIDDTHHIETGNNSGILGSLTLRVIEKKLEMKTQSKCTLRFSQHNKKQKHLQEFEPFNVKIYT
ncbi:hypothetical protein Ahy_A04g017188 [Arachis hypogaea]|uniref:Uncharacterized protein n=1 Tax=Arachis hypogaea TaxID=3818 RepID=A0A445DA89_ARAHY|nr:hypothetical protein Ahy_A04g017188 [Arachis hypogaea]